LATILHSRLGDGRVAFLATPNYGLISSDIHRFARGPPDGRHITLQQLEKPGGDDPVQLAITVNPLAAFAYGAHIDAIFQGTGNSLPPDIILDYVYGVAAYKRWRGGHGGQVHGAMERYRVAHYVDIPIPPCPRSNEDEDDDPSSEEKDDRNDPDYNSNDGSAEERNNAHDPNSPPATSLQRRRYQSERGGEVMARAMDELNTVLMSICGTTPQEAAERSEKRVGEEELKAREVGRSKVMQWMRTADVGSS